MPVYYFPVVFFVIILVSLYDLKYHKVPNWISLPLMLVGFWVGFPGSPVLWMGSTFIFQAWMLGLIGGGDAKLWVGLLWCLLSFAGDKIILVMSISLIVTGLVQLLVRAIAKKKIEIGIKTPGAWRTLVFLSLLAYLNSAGWLRS
jgi:Flp pilus assembly protein protease CpaA